jgi:hypothetical protein
MNFRKMKLDIINHPLGNSRGRIVFGYRKSGAGHQIEILGKLMPHEAELGLYLQELEKFRREHPNERMQPASTKFSERLNEMDFLNKALASGEITIEEYERRRITYLGSEKMRTKRNIDAIRIDETENAKRLSGMEETRRKLEWSKIRLLSSPWWSNKMAGYTAKQRQINRQSRKQIQEKMRQVGIADRDKLLPSEGYGEFQEITNTRLKQKLAQVIMKSGYLE